MASKLQQAKSRLSKARKDEKAGKKGASARVTKAIKAVEKAQYDRGRATCKAK